MITKLIVTILDAKTENTTLLKVKQSSLSQVVWLGLDRVC